MTGQWFDGHRCPVCGATLLKDDVTDEIYCSLVGCSYGLDATVKMVNGELTEVEVD